MAPSRAVTYVVEGKFLGTCSATDADGAAAASKGVDPADDRVAAAVSDAVAEDDSVTFASARAAPTHAVEMETGTAAPNPYM